MAALLIGMAIMAVMMTMALPVWSTAAKRAREDELVFRGEQYARAIMLYQRKYANALPPSIDLLVNEKFLRRKYLDPMTGGEFQALTGSVGQGVPGAGQAGQAAQAGRGGTTGAGAATGQGTTSSSLAQQNAGRGGAQGGRTGGPGQPFAAGGIVGVASKSTEKSLRLYNGRGAYNEWTFVAVQRQTQAGGPGGAAGQSGTDGRGGRGGQPPAGGSGFGGRGQQGQQGTGANRPPQSPFGGRGFRPGDTQGR